MATLRLPIQPGKLAKRYLVELDGTWHGLTFRWAEKMQVWLLDIDTNRETVLTSVRVVTSEDLLAPWAYMQADGRLPVGTFQVRDTEGLGRDPDTTTIGDKVVFLYTEAP